MVKFQLEHMVKLDHIYILIKLNQPSLFQMKRMYPNSTENVNYKKNSKKNVK